MIVVWDGRGVANDGQPYQNGYAWIMRLEDGAVVDGTAFYDSISCNDPGRRHAPTGWRAVASPASLRDADVVKRVQSML